MSTVNKANQGIGNINNFPVTNNADNKKTVSQPTVIQPIIAQTADNKGLSSNLSMNDMIAAKKGIALSSTFPVSPITPPIAARKVEADKLVSDLLSQPPKAGIRDLIAGLEKNKNTTIGNRYSDKDNYSVYVLNSLVEKNPSRAANLLSQGSKSETLSSALHITWLSQSGKSNNIIDKLINEGIGSSSLNAAQKAEGLGNLIGNTRIKPLVNEYINKSFALADELGGRKDNPPAQLIAVALRNGAINAGAGGGAGEITREFLSSGKLTDAVVRDSIRSGSDSLKNLLKTVVNYGGMGQVGKNLFTSVAAATPNNEPKGEVSNFLKGFADSVWESLKSNWKMITDPVATVKALWQMVSDPMATMNALKDTVFAGVKEFQEAPPEKKAQMLGKVVGQFTVDALLAKGAGKLSAVIKETAVGKQILAKAGDARKALGVKVAATFSDEAAEAAAARLRKNSARLNSGIPLDLLPDMVIVAGNAIKKGAVTLKEFSKTLNDKFNRKFNESDLYKLYRDQIIDSGAGKEIRRASNNQVIEQSVIKEAKTKVADLVKNNKPTDLRSYINEVRNQFGESFAKELELTSTKFIDGLYDSSKRNLDIHELLGGHTKELHIGRSESALRKRLATDPTLKNEKLASAFRNEAVADRAVGKIIGQHKEEIEAFLKNGSKGKLEIVMDIGETAGNGVVKNGGVWDSSKVYALIVKDSSAKGWHVVTSYPTTAKPFVK
jgi:Bacterial CdiA-CT RNAse A domain